MKKGYWVVAALVLFSFASTIIFISMMPEQVPMHYNAMGEVDRMGSKYENLIFPGITLLVGIPLLLARRKTLTRTEEIVLLSTVISIIACFDVLNVVLLYKALTYEPGKALDLNILKTVMVFLGVLFVLLGNVLPKVRRNAMMGLRTSWTMYNDVVWQKSQRFSGISMVVCGLLLLLAALVLPDTAAAVVMAVLVVAWIVAALLMSYAFYRREKAG